MSSCPPLLPCRLLDPIEVDLIFTRVKEKGARRIKYKQFLDALCLMAARKYPDVDPADAFAALLERHVFQAPAAMSLTAVGVRARTPWGGNTL